MDDDRELDGQEEFDPFNPKNKNKAGKINPVGEDEDFSGSKDGLGDEESLDDMADAEGAILSEDEFDDHESEDLM